MLSYIIKRLVLVIPTLLSVAVIIFFMLRVVPGDIVELKLRGDGGQVTEEVLTQERQRLGLDKPLIVQFERWMLGLATFDLGRSMWTDRPVAEEIGGRLGLSFEVAVLAAVIAVIVAIPLGTLAALDRGSWIDYFIRTASMSGLAIPSFWFGMMMIMALLSMFNWLPAVTYTPFFSNPVANLSQLIWPAIAVGLRFSAVVTRMVRSSMIEVMREDYIRTARAKGIDRLLILRRHALRNAMLPTITVIGLEFVFLLGGLVVTEQVFNLNGIGRLFVDAVRYNDFVLIQAIIMLSATAFVVVNLLIDLIYAMIDPRIQY